MNNWKRIFSIIWAGQFFSILSSTIVSFAIILWLSFETGSAETLALAAIASMLPQSLIGLFAGVYVDRWDRKKVMIGADSFIALCTLAMAAMFYFDSVEVWYIYILLGLRSVGSAFHTPAMEASVPLLAPESELTRIAGINQIIFSVCNIAGPALGALFITVMDISQVLLLDVAGAAIACLSLLFVTIPNPQKESKHERHIWREMKVGLLAVTSRRGINLMFLFSILAMFCIMPVSILFPLMTLNHFMGNAYQMSVIEAVWGVGMFLGGLFLGFNQKKLNKPALINLMYILIGVTFALSGLLPPHGFVWFAVLTAIGGIGGSVYYSAFMALIQEKIDPAKLGRVFSMFMSVSQLPSMIGLLGTGFLADSLGLPNTFIIGGFTIVLIGIVSFLFPSVMELDKKTSEKTLRKD
ncbi:MAG: MFS transporter [Dysgonomonas sp.]